MFRSLALVAGLAGTSLARTSSVDNLFLPGFEGQPLVGRIVTADKHSTQYFVQCDPEAEKTFCGVGRGVSVTMRSETFDFNILEPDHFTLEERCVIKGDTADCTWTADGDEAPERGVTSTTMTEINTADFFIPVTLTGGFNALHTNVIELRQASDDCSATSASPGASNSGTDSTTTNDELTTGSVTGRPTAVTVTTTQGGSSTPTPTSGASQLAAGSILGAVAVGLGMLFL